MWFCSTACRERRGCNVASKSSALTRVSVLQVSAVQNFNPPRAQESIKIMTLLSYMWDGIRVDTPADASAGSSLESSVDRLSQGLGSGLTVDWRAGPLWGRQVLYRHPGFTFHKFSTFRVPHVHSLRRNEALSDCVLNTDVWVQLFLDGTNEQAGPFLFLFFKEKDQCLSSENLTSRKRNKPAEKTNSACWCCLQCSGLAWAVCPTPAASSSCATISWTRNTKPRVQIPSELKEFRLQHRWIFKAV